MRFFSAIFPGQLPEVLEVRDPFQLFRPPASEVSLKHRLFSCCYQKCPQGGSTVSHASRAPRLTGSLQRAAFQGLSGQPVPRLVSFDIFFPSPAHPSPQKIPKSDPMLRVILEWARSLGRHGLQQGPQGLRALGAGELFKELSAQKPYFPLGALVQEEVSEEMPASEDWGPIHRPQGAPPPKWGSFADPCSLTPSDSGQSSLDNHRCSGSRDVSPAQIS